MEVIETGFEGLFLLKQKIFTDERGFFMESFNEKQFNSLVGNTYHFVQDNQSYSRAGVLRGLHFQRGDFAQAKLVRVLEGEVLDVVVDMRPNSLTFKKHYSVKLSSENNLQMIVPRGFAHGFVVLSETATFFYKCDNYYSPQHDGGIRFDDEELNIDWLLPKNELTISEKDLKLPLLKELL